MEKCTNTREFLRNFKNYKNLLLGGKIVHLVIQLGKGEELEVTRRRKSSTGMEIAAMFQSLEKPIRIERPTDLFDEFLDRIHERKRASRRAP